MAHFFISLRRREMKKMELDDNTAVTLILLGLFVLIAVVAIFG